MVLIHLPPKARGVGICFAWKQAPTVPKPLAAATSSVPPTYAATYPTTYPTKEATTTTSTTTEAPLAFVPPNIGSHGVGGKIDSLELSLIGQAGKVTTTTSTDATVTTEGATTTPLSTSTVRTTSVSDVTSSIPSGETMGYTFGPVEMNDQPMYDDTIEDDPLLSAEFGHKKTKTGTKRNRIQYKVGNKVIGARYQREEAVEAYQGCWAIDQVIIVNTANVPSVLQDSFDPVNPSDWLSFPGAYFKVIVFFVAGETCKKDAIWGGLGWDHVWFKKNEF